MALKDLKSDLSKFRMPKQDPLKNKKVTEVNKKLNQTPLSSRLSSIPDIGKIDKTPTKSGVNPSQFDNSSNFLGETNPSKMDNSSNFLGETEPTKMDNSSKFLGETEPTKMDNVSNFLGETDPNKMDNSSNFLGETEPTKMDNSSNFLGETDATKMDNSSNFLGETTPSDFDNSSNFLGQTTPSNFDNSSNFLGETTQPNFDNSSNFLGETTPSNFDNSSNFLGETTPSNFDNSSNFLGETTPSEVNYISDIHAEGFTSNFNNVEATKFVGVNPDNTLFDSTNSTYSNFLNSFPGLSFVPGYDRFKPIGNYTGDTQRYNPDKKYYIDGNLTNQGISQLQEMVGSPSFLEKMYDKFNLKDDSFNTTLPLTRHPLVLSGIQKKGGNPEDYGQFGLSFTDGLIRGGTITATTRAFIDTARIATWLLSPKGQLWSGKQTALQLTNKSNKIWTPLNLLTAVGAQHLGFKPNRSGLFPFNSPLRQEGGPGQKLYKIYIEDGTSYRKPVVKVGLPIASATDLIGGFDSFYGIGSTFTTRYEDSFDNDSKRRAAEKSQYTFGSSGQKYDPFILKEANLPIPGVEFLNTYEKEYLDLVDDNSKKNFGLGGLDPTQQNNKNTKISSVVVDIERNLTTNTPDIQKYETIAYGSIPERNVGTTQINDFRRQLNSKHNDLAKSENYGVDNYVTKKNFGITLGHPISDLTERDKWDLNAIDKNNSTRHDKINASGIGDDEQDDFVNLWFKPYDYQDKSIQFRGIVSGISETFSPSWDSIKYNGRADSAYKYSTFERTLSFNFKVIATSKLEMKPLWQKLQFLSTMTMASEYSSQGYKGTLVKFRLGSLWNDELSFINSLSYSIPDDISWDTDFKQNQTNIQIPKSVDVSIGLTILPREGNYVLVNGTQTLPALGQDIYSLGDLNIKNTINLGNIT
jgi:hypothetical protein